MRSHLVVVVGVRAEDALQVTPAEDEDVVEALPSRPITNVVQSRFVGRARSARCR
jgi:hypothetical protein